MDLKIQFKIINSQRKKHLEEESLHMGPLNTSGMCGANGFGELSFVTIFL